MIDIALLRSDPDAVAQALARRGIALPLDEILGLDRERRAIQTRADSLRATQKSASKEFAKLSPEERKAKQAELATLSADVEALGKENAILEDRIRDLMLTIPNLPHESVPDGAGDDSNVELRKVGEARAFDFEARDHLEIGEALGVIEVERAAKVSGSRFAYLLGQAVLLELALVRFAVDRLAPHGFMPVVPPVLVRREAMEWTGFLPTDEAQIYKLADDELYLVGTSEVSLAAMHQGEFLDPDTLPLRYCGISTCFRREAGTYGKDTRGIFRVHQFDKVEMFSFTDPDASWDEHEVLLACEEEIFKALEVPYRVVNICAGELGASAAKKYDVEAWLPGQGAYREVTSCSNCTDYQARRLGTKVKTAEGTKMVHTLNGTAIAVGRAIIAVVENHQQGDGTVAIPDALRPYTGFEVLGR